MFFFFKQKTAYEMRISDWRSDVCSSDLDGLHDGLWWMPANILIPLIFAMLHGRPLRACIPAFFAMLLAVAALCLALGPAMAQTTGQTPPSADPFTVAKVPVDASADSAAAARPIAIAEGERRAFTLLPD